MICYLKFRCPISSIIHSTYLDHLKNLNNLDYFQERVILAPRLKDVDKINEYMLSMLPNEEKVYLSSDIIKQTQMLIP